MNLHECKQTEQKETASLQFAYTENVQVAVVYYLYICSLHY